MGFWGKVEAVKKVASSVAKTAVKVVLDGGIEFDPSKMIENAQKKVSMNHKMESGDTVQQLYYEPGIIYLETGRASVVQKEKKLFDLVQEKLNGKSKLAQKLGKAFIAVAKIAKESGFKAKIGVDIWKGRLGISISGNPLKPIANRIAGKLGDKGIRGIAKLIIKKLGDSGSVSLSSEVEVSKDNVKVSAEAKGSIAGESKSASTSKTLFGSEKKEQEKEKEKGKEEQKKSDVEEEC